MASDRLSAAARRIVRGLLSGKSLDELASRDDPVRTEVEAHLRSALRDGKGTPVAPPVEPAPPGLAIAYSDGASRGNPGPAAIGVRILAADGTELLADGETIGTATNNAAEYRAAIAALEKAHALGITEIELRLDSELVVKQLTGAYRVKNADLAALKAKVDRLSAAFHTFFVRHVRRERNAETDRLANEALDRE